MDKKKKEASKSGSTEKPGYEKALKRLEEIAYYLEKGDGGLEQSIALFEEGIQLARYCHELLEEAERKIEILQKGPSGKPDPKKVKVKPDTGELEEDEEMQGSLL